MIHMRPFNDFEIKNMKFLINKNVDFTQVQVTKTGLKKSIMDATTPMRAFFLEKHIHDFSLQMQGTLNKVLIDTWILNECQEYHTQTSFYRPETKKGDPRIWIYKLTNHTQADDIHVIFCIEKTLFTINITKIDIEKCYNSILDNPIKEHINTLYSLSSIVSDELLGKFRSFSNTWIKSEVNADTGIGRTIESMLGITMNSSKAPDYKGIEIKSNRDKRSSKKNILFTQTPDWNISTYKSGRDIVNKYGYLRDMKKTLQCTVTCDKPNPQSLGLNVNLFVDLLELQSLEESTKHKLEDVAAWNLINLHNRILTKHHETFWIGVDNQMRNDGEYFRYTQIEHTKNPAVNQFDLLLERSLITVDLLLCRPSGRGDTYSFKIKAKGMPILFPESTIYKI